MPYMFSGVTYSKELAINNIEFSVIADSEDGVIEKLFDLTGARRSFHVKLHSIREITGEREQKDHTVGVLDCLEAQS